MYIAGLINPYGAPAQVAAAVMSDHIDAVVTQHLLDELAGVLVRPKFRRWVSLADAVAFVETLGGKADVRPDPGGSQRFVRDPDDDYLVAVAKAVEAMIVTGDADLLDADLGDVKIVTPRQLVDMLGAGYPSHRSVSTTAHTPTGSVV